MSKDREVWVVKVRPHATAEDMDRLIAEAEEESRKLGKVMELVIVEDETEEESKP